MRKLRPWGVRGSLAVVQGWLIIVLLVGCGPAQPETTPSNSPRVAVEPDSRPPRSTPALPTLTLSSEHPPLTELSVPADGKWHTELVSATLDQALQVLMEQLVDGSSPDSAAVTRLADERFVGSDLVPEDLQVMFQDRHLTVLRSPSDSVPKYFGPPGLLAVLSQLQPLQATAKQRGKFKISRIQIRSNVATTEVVVQLSAHDKRKVRQHNAVWACDWELDKLGRKATLLSISLTSYEQTIGQGQLFVDITESVLGANDSYHEQLAYGHDHWLKRLELVQGIVPTSYHGLAVADVNGDGLDDLYVCQPGGLQGGLPNRLYLQQSDGTAVDASTSSQLDWLVETPSALFIDLDGDGDQDMVGATMAGLIFAENNGQAIFQPRATKLIPEAPPISLAAADFDNDGDVDIYACCYAPRASTELLGRPIPYHDANNGSRNALFRNDTNWRFTNVTKQVGLDSNNRRFSFAAAWEDFDNDGDQDLYVANDFGRNNLFQNTNGRFSDVAGDMGVEDLSAGMSVSWGDYNNDGWMDLYVSNMWSSAGGRVAFQREFLGASGDATTLGQFQRHARGNSLFMNLGASGRLGFRDVSETAAVTRGRWAWSSRFVDINNDSLLDLVVANGNITQEDKDDL